MKESELLKQVMVAVSAAGVLCFRNNTGVLLDATSRAVRFGLAPGSADLICVVPPNGRALALEIKTNRRGSQQSEQQKNFERAWREFGGIYEVIRSVPEALAVIAQARECRGVQKLRMLPAEPDGSDFEPFI